MSGRELLPPRRYQPSPGCTWGCGDAAGDAALLQHRFLLFPFFIRDADAEGCWRRSKDLGETRNG
jgi:hypothetical protein